MLFIRTLKNLIGLRFGYMYLDMLYIVGRNIRVLGSLLDDIIYL